ncbi:MAG: fumarylacetoacetate hydrolase family protein [Candidatus Korarchaeota archaeon]|nr:fumarylacetoacetate hydrolase family protein [Candidatus Korarchaeota archaeon]NIU83705.1 2-hydroxyhepta-2,4-diene-1,7-dioate isomerase [Candidatus Thorarchaeota archaeon]NIW14890.1 2-hydroxyhepta-2,4-diene-1,7-dioate isomerase [Candidatus Thorarchaeota archaeon]NIW52022.1 2-hydroxyhepta-2,4-diene-1,7-dioate isomerase [Candidatus Korarchaeota archaeon]
MKYVRFRDLAGFIRNGIYRDEFILFGNEEFDPENVSILPPVMPTKIVGVGLNYADHAEETGSEPPDRPMFFLKPPNTVTGHEKVVTLPFGKERVDYEGELGVVIGQQCRNVKKRNAMDVVWGFTCVNDISNRDDQPNSFLVRTKAFDNAAPMGPVIATPDEVPQDAHLELRVNGEIKQNSTRSQLIFSIPELIEEITGFMTLEPGDVISTGTPAGVGPLRDGDTVEIEIEGIGTLKHYVKR